MKGPLFTTFLLADEINRAPAKTQSALLEAMQERTVTIDRASHPLSPNFTVFATQNPIESEGTYPLPEAQKDRFMMKIPMTWPQNAEELSLARRSLNETAPEAVLQRGEVTPCLSEADLASLREALSLVLVSDQLVDYAVQVVRRMRSDDAVLVRGRSARQPVVATRRARLGGDIRPRFREPRRRSLGGGPGAGASHPATAGVGTGRRAHRRGARPHSARGASASMSSPFSARHFCVHSLFPFAASIDASCVDRRSVRTPEVRLQFSC